MVLVQWTACAETTLEGLLIGAFAPTATWTLRCTRCAMFSAILVAPLGSIKIGWLVTVPFCTMARCQRLVTIRCQCTTVIAVQAHTSGLLRRMFTRSARPFPQAVVHLEAAAAAAQGAREHDAANAAAVVGRSRVKKKTKTGEEPVYTPYQSRQSTEANAWRRSGSGSSMQQISTGQANHGDKPKWKHFPSTAHVSGLLPQASLELLDEARKCVSPCPLLVDCNLSPAPASATK